VGSEDEEFLPDALLDLPEVGGLTGEGGRMHFAEGGEPLRVVRAEEEVDVLVGVYAEELSYDLDGEDLRVGELGGRATLTDTPSFELIVHQTEDGDDEGAKIHRKRSPLASVGLGTIERREVFFVIQPFRETCTRG
jgi:hypothetical protein